jgi:hypothetical protein
LNTWWERRRNEIRWILVELEVEEKKRGST